MGNILIDRYKDRILGVTELFTEEDLSYNKENNVAYHELSTIKVDDQLLHLCVSDEKFNNLIALVNALKADIRPEMRNVGHTGDITTETIQKYCKLVETFLNGVTIDQIVRDSFPDVDSLVKYYGFTIQDEDFLTENPIDVLKERVLEDIAPKCRTAKISVESLENTESEISLVNAVVDEISHVVACYEDKIAKGAENLSQLTDKAATIEKELISTKQTNLDNLEKMQVLVEKVNSLTKENKELADSKNSKAEEDLEVALKTIKDLNAKLEEKDSNIASLQNKVKSMDTEPGEVVSDDTLLDCIDYLRDMDSREVMRVLLKFLNSSSITNKVKTPVVLEIFDLIINS